MISNPCIEVQTTSETRFSVPAWFAEVVIMAGYLEKQGRVSAFAHQVRLVRRRFGTSEPIDFLARLFGYARSFERTRASFFERLLPSARHSIATHLNHFALKAEVALVRLDGQYGDATVIAQRGTRLVCT